MAVEKVGAGAPPPPEEKDKFNRNQEAFEKNLDKMLDAQLSSAEMATKIDILKMYDKTTNRLQVGQG